MAYVSGTEPTASGCVLCAAGLDEPRDPHVVHRTALTITLLNRYPYSSGHVMVVPLRHAMDITALTPEERTEVMEATDYAVRSITTALSADGFNIGVNQGTAGASLDHFHLHVVPRWHGDTNFMPVIGETKVLPQDLEATAATLRTAFEAGQ